MKKWRQKALAYERVSSVLANEIVSSVLAYESEQFSYLEVIINDEDVGWCDHESRVGCQKWKGASGIYVTNDIPIKLFL